MNDFQWTDERRRLSAMAEITTQQVRAGVLEPEEALLLTINPPVSAELDALVDQMIDAEERAKQGRPSWTDEQRMKQSERRRQRYANDPEYREKEKARKRDKKYREAESEARKERRRRNVAAGRPRDGAVLLVPGVEQS